MCSWGHHGKAWYRMDGHLLDSDGAYKSQPSISCGLNKYNIIYISKPFLHLSTQILIRRPFEPALLQELDSFGKSKPKYSQFANKGRRVELLLDSLEFFCISLFNSTEDIWKHLGKEVKKCEIMFLDKHLIP